VRDDRLRAADELVEPLAKRTDVARKRLCDQRIALTAEGLKLLNFNVEAQCTPSRSALLTGRHAIRSGMQAVPIAGGLDGLTRWEVRSAQALSDAGYATGMWGKWHLGSDPDNRSPVAFGFDEAVWCPRTADEVLWTMQSYFPNGEVTAEPYAGPTKIPLEQEQRWSPPMTRSDRRRGRAVHRFGAGKRQFPCYCEYLAPAPAQASSPGDLRRGMGM
jgi:arylsulfatase